MSEFVMGASVHLTNNFSGTMSAMTSDTERFKASAIGANQTVANLTKGLSGVNGDGFQEMGTTASQAATAANSIVAPINNVTASTNRAEAAIQSFDRGWQKVKALPGTLRTVGTELKNNVAHGFTAARLQAAILISAVKTLAQQRFTNMVSGLQQIGVAVRSLPSTLLNVGATLKNNVVNGFIAAKQQATTFITTVKTLGQEKFNGIVSSLRQVKTTLTEGKTGAAGFVSALKNIGKISVATTVNGVSKLASSLKSVGKSGISATVNGVKNLASSLKTVAHISLSSVISGTSKLATNLKTVASTKLSSVTSSIKNLVSGFKSGENGSNSLHGALKKVASVSFSALHSGLTKIGSAAKSAGSAVLSGLGKAATTTLKGTAVAIGAAATATAALVTQSVKAFADYEQLTGGVETLFKGSAGIVESYANNAYKTAGLSANAYMETVTGFSASLLQSLGGDTAKAADYAHLAITDMADNANKMGTGMDMIQNAYQGFAKQNYTMLDNLKLGYGGTKEEMQRLLTDAGKLAGTKFDISSYADIVQAIHTVQESMGITGTTALEAEHTISGSLASMKAAWSNTLVALTTGGDNFDTCIDNLVSSAKTFGSNIMPAITSALSGVGRLVESLAPMIAKEVPTLVTTVLPPLINAATSIIQGIANALPALLTTVVPSLINGITQIVGSLTNVLSAHGPQIINTLVDALSQGVVALLGMVPQLTMVGIQLIFALAQGIVNNIPMILQAGIQAIRGLQESIWQNLPQILQMGVQLIISLVQGIVQSLPYIIQSAISGITSFIQTIISNLPLIIQAAVQIVVALAVGLIQAIPQLVAAVPQLVSAIIDTILHTNWLEVGWEIVKGIGKGLWDGVKSIFGGGGEEGGAAVSIGAADGMTANMGAITGATTQVSQTMTQGLQPDMAAINMAGANAMTSMSEGITANAGIVYNSASALAPGITDSINTGLSTVDTSSTATTIGTNITNGVTTGIQTGTSNVVAAATEMVTQVQSTVEAGIAGISTTVGNFDITGFKTSCDGMVTAITECMNRCVQIVTTGMQTIQSVVSSINLYSSGVNIMQGLNNGMQAMQGSIIATAQSIANSVKATVNAALDIHSPSRVLEDSGEFTTEGYANGLLNLIDLVKTNAKKVADTAIEPFSVRGRSGDIPASGRYETGKRNGLGGLRVSIENLVLQNVGDKDPKQLVKEILNELYTQLGGDDEVLSDVDMGVLL